MSRSRHQIIVASDEPLEKFPPNPLIYEVDLDRRLWVVSGTSVFIGVTSAIVPKADINLTSRKRRRAWRNCVAHRVIVKMRGLGLFVFGLRKMCAAYARSASWLTALRWLGKGYPASLGAPLHPHRIRLLETSALMNGNVVQ